MSLESRYKAILKKEEACFQLKKKLRKDALEQGCEHALGREWESDSDDGYGRWWKVKRRECLICGKRFYWGFDKWVILHDD